MIIYGLTYDRTTIGDYDVLDGDRKKVSPIEEGFEWFGDRGMALYPDGLIVYKNIMTQAIRMNSTHLPTKLRWNGNSPMSDFKYMWNTPIVSAAFRAVVEKLEPDRHQFEPVSFVSQGGNVIDEYFWFFPLARIDTFDREHTTHNLVNDGRMWSTVSGGKFVANLAQVGDHHVWRDPREAGSESLFVSEALHRAMQTSSISGLEFYAFETI